VFLFAAGPQVQESCALVQKGRAGATVDSQRNGVFHSWGKEKEALSCRNRPRSATLSLRCEPRAGDPRRGGDRVPIGPKWGLGGGKEKVHWGSVATPFRNFVFALASLLPTLQDNALLAEALTGPRISVCETWHAPLTL